MYRNAFIKDVNIAGKNKKNPFRYSVGKDGRFAFFYQYISNNCITLRSKGVNFIHIYIFVIEISIKKKNKKLNRDTYLILYNFLRAPICGRESADFCKNEKSRSAR